MNTTSIPQDAAEYTEAERNAMRTFLQRCEVRISTLHSVATAFISGAGLLLLIPVFFRDILIGILNVLLDQSMQGNLYPSLGDFGGGLLTVILLLLVAYPLLLSLAIPLYGVVLLLKDIVHFYFTIYMPGSASHILNPTFSLTGITFSESESPEVKRAVLHYQYHPENANFMMAFSEGKRAQYFDTFVERTDGGIIPHSRTPEALAAKGWLPDDHNLKEVQRFNTAFGIARSLDRTLVEEVALTEMTIVRYVLYLRRLVLRYVKTLLMFLWTTMIAFIMIPFLQDERFPTLVMLSGFYLIWSALVMWIIRMPFRWIYRHRLTKVNPDHIDTQMKVMENQVVRWCYTAIVTSSIALVLAIIAFIGA